MRTANERRHAIPQVLVSEQRSICFVRRGQYNESVDGLACFVIDDRGGSDTPAAACGWLPHAGLGW